VGGICAPRTKLQDDRSLSTSGHLGAAEVSPLSGLSEVVVDITESETLSIVQAVSH
jgi:ATP phosphoribosyltransferase